MHVIILPDQRLGQYELEIALSPDRVGEHLIRLDTFNRLILADRLEISHLNIRLRRMIKPKTAIYGRLGNSSGDWIRTNDLRVMSCGSIPQNYRPKSYLFCLTPRSTVLNEPRDG